MMYLALLGACSVGWMTGNWAFGGWAWVMLLCVLSPFDL